MKELAHAQFVERAFDVIELADRHAAGREHRVEGERFGQAGANFFGTIARDFQDRGLAAGLAHRARERVGAGVDDLCAGRNLVDVDQFVAGRDDRDTGGCGIRRSSSG